MHPLLVRHLRKFCRDGAVLDLPAWTAAIDDAFASFESDRSQIEHTLEVMSRELGARNRQLAAQLDDKQRMMDELTATNRALLELNQRLAAAQNQLLQAEKMASIGQLAAGVAHEINNPIAYVHSNMGALEGYLAQIFRLNTAYAEAAGALPPALLGQLARLRTELAYDEIVADVGDLMRESKDGLARVKKIVQDLKDFSRVDNSGWEQVDLNQGLSSTLSLVRHQIPSQVEIVCELGALPEVDCVLSQLNQVFMNILVNAAQAIGACGTLTIRSGVDGETVWISIGDSGCGIAPHNLPRIFDAFFTTKPVGVGTGLGLSLSYSIVKRHGGRIDVSSELGVGTTFTIVLPIHRP